jgi:hypothetical protein
MMKRKKLLKDSFYIVKVTWHNTTKSVHCGIEQYMLGLIYRAVTNKDSIQKQQSLRKEL